MTREEVLRALDELLELPAGTLQGPELLEDLEQWNSMAVMGFIALADSHNGTTLSARQIASSRTVGDLLELAKVQS
jgi:acyl carrier protein